VTVSLSTPFPDGARGVFRWPFAGLLPQAGEARVSAPSDPRAVRRCIGRSVLAARPAGPVELAGALRFPRRARLASEAAKCGNVNERRPMGRSIEDGSVRLLGLFAPVCDPHAAAFVFSAIARSCLGLSPLSGFTGAAPLRRARTDGAEWSVAFHRSPGCGSPAAESAHGLWRQ